MRQKRRRQRSGAMLTQLALVLILLLGFVALSVDVGLFLSQLGQLQIAATSAAAGAAMDLPDEAVSTALALAESNMPSGIHGTVLLSSDVELGHWDKTTRTFAADATPFNAVRVTTQKSAANGNPSGWLVASIFGLTALDLRATATGLLLPEFYGAVAASGSIDASGNGTIDSYSAEDGPYDPTTAGDEGSLVTDGDVEVGGSATINGDVSGSSVTSSGSATITGSTAPLRRPLQLPPVDTTEIALDNDNDSLPLYLKGNKLVSPLDAQRNFELVGGVDYEIPPGRYYFNDFKLGGQSTLRVVGPTTIYLTGDLDTSGGDVINSTEIPSNLTILMTGGSAKINASLDWYGVLYAPNTDVTVSGSGDIYGVIVGANVTLSGTGDIHFDTSVTLTDEGVQIPRRSTVVD